MVCAPEIEAGSGRNEYHHYQSRFDQFNHIGDALRKGCMLRRWIRRVSTIW